MLMSLSFQDATVISAYSRAQALADGSLIDVTDLARDAGFTVPVAVTAAAWSDCIAWNPEQEVAPQNETGRLWDTLAMARFTAGLHADSCRLRFPLMRIPRGGLRPTLTHLILTIGHGDHGEPVITIMHPEED